MIIYEYGLHQDFFGGLHKYLPHFQFCPLLYFEALYIMDLHRTRSNIEVGAKFL